MGDYAKEIAEMWVDDTYRTKANDLFNNIMLQALWATRHEQDVANDVSAYRKAAEEADDYFADLIADDYFADLIADDYFADFNKEEIPSAATIPIPEDRLKRSARRKSDIRHKAKNAETLRRIYDKTKPDPEASRKADHAALDFKFFGRDIEDLVSKGKRLSEIGGVPKRKNYSKGTRRDPEVPMRGSGYKKSQNWK